MAPENQGSTGSSSPPRYKPRRRWVSRLLGCAFVLFVIFYSPFARLFGFQAYEEQHGNLLEVIFSIVLFGVLDQIYDRIFHDPERLEEIAAIKEDLLQRRMTRFVPAVRWALLVGALGMVSAGWLYRDIHGPRLLFVAVPLFVLIVLLELDTVVFPGESIVPNIEDELLVFFRSRMLKVGYITAIVSLATLYVVSLFVPTYAVLLIPIVLTLSLVAPGLLYRRLDRQAGTDG